MTTLINDLQTRLVAAKAEVAKIEAEIAAVPSEFHTFEAEVWAKIKAFFHANPAAAAPNPPQAPPAGA